MFKKKIEFKKGVPGEAILIVMLVVFLVLVYLLQEDWCTQGLLLILMLLIIKRLYFGKLKLDASDLVLFWGLPGSGKTLFLTKTAYDNRDNWYIGVNEEYEHLSLKDFEYTRESLACFRFDNAALFYDEASLNGFDNRDFKVNFKDPAMLETFKKHRHMDMPMVFSNQGFEECDIKIRKSLANKTYYVEDMGLWCRASLMIRTVTISEITGEPQEGYRFPTMLERILQPSVQLYAWKSFYGKFYSTRTSPKRVEYPLLTIARTRRSLIREVNHAA